MTLEHEAKKMVKTLEAEIERTPTGQTRNVLCDARIIIQAFIDGET